MMLAFAQDENNQLIFGPIKELKTPKDDSTKEEILEFIKSTAQQASSNKSEKNSIDIYYTGCSREVTGDWTMIDADVTFNDVIDALRDGGAANRCTITLTLDAPFAGQWVNQAIKMVKKK